MTGHTLSRSPFPGGATVTHRVRKGAVTVSFVPGAEGQLSSSNRAVVSTVFSVSRRVGNAVVRNLIRRRLRAITREIATPVSGTYLITTSPEARKLKFEELRQLVVEGFMDIATMESNQR